MNAMLRGDLITQNIIEIKPLYCEEHVNDLQRIYDLADELGAAAAAMSGHGQQGYAAFIEARDNFRDVTTSIVEKYRRVVTRV